MNEKNKETVHQKKWVECRAKPQPPTILMHTYLLLKLDI